MWIKKSEAILKCFTHVDLRGGSRIFLRRGYTRLLLDFNTNKLHSFLFVFFFLLQNTSCIRKPQVISRGGGGAHTLHPPPISTPGSHEAFGSRWAQKTKPCFVTLRTFFQLDCKSRFSKH